MNLMGTLTSSPLTLASTDPIYLLLLSVYVSVTLMVNHSVLISHTFSETLVFIVMKVSHYDFGTTVGMIHAKSLTSDFLSKQDKLQQIVNSKKCIPFNYTVYSKLDYELLLYVTNIISASIWLH